MDARSALLRAIAQAGRERDALNRRAASEIVTHAALRQSITAQRQTLTDAQRQIRTAIAAASRDADEVGVVDGAKTADLYDRTTAALQDQLAVIESLLAQLTESAGTASLTASSADRLLRRSSDGMEAALREAVRQLGQLERLERERVIERVRRRDGAPQQE
ncbi:MAG: hypothetical protein ABI232_12640 [Jatrophihabitantaceae bacterium]